MHVEVKGNTDKDFEIALAEFKKQVKKAGIFDDLRKKEHYLKPSIRRKRKREEAIRRRKREEKYNGRKTY